MRKSKKVKLQEEIADLRNLIEANHEYCVCEEIRSLKNKLSEQEFEIKNEIEKLQNKVNYLKDYIVFKNKVKKGQKFVIIEECDVFSKEKEPHHTFIDFDLLFGNKFCVKKLCVQYLDEYETLHKLYVQKQTNDYVIKEGSLATMTSDYLLFYRDSKLEKVYKIDTEKEEIKEVDLDLFLKAHVISKEK